MVMCVTCWGGLSDFTVFVLWFVENERVELSVGTSACGFSWPSSPPHCMSRVLFAVFAAATWACSEHCDLNAPSKCRGDCPCGWVGSDTICSLFSTPVPQSPTQYKREPAFHFFSAVDAVQESMSMSHIDYMHATANGDCMQLPARLLKQQLFCHGPYPKPQWGVPCAP